MKERSRLWMANFLKRMIFIFLRSPLELTQGIHAIFGTMMFGAWLISPFWGPAPSTLYNVMTRWIEGAVIGVLFFAAGFVQLLSIASNNAGMQKTSAAFSAILWWLIFSHVWVADATMVTVPLIFYMVALNSFVFVRLTFIDYYFKLNK